MVDPEVKKNQRNYEVKIEKRVRVEKPREEVYRFWRNFENLPRFMEYLKEVKVLDEKHSHWVAKAPLGTKVEWDAEIVTDSPNEVLSWQSVEKADVENAGSVRFDSAGGGGTELKVEFAYNPPAGKLGESLAGALGQDPGTRIEKDLNHFKEIIEQLPSKRELRQ
jgi:uncharacterized membrane protein